MVVEIFAACKPTDFPSEVPEARRCLAKAVKRRGVEEKAPEILYVEQHRYLFLRSCGLLATGTLHWDKHRFMAFNWCCPLIANILLRCYNIGERPFSSLYPLKRLESTRKRQESQRARSDLEEPVERQSYSNL